MEYFNNDKSLKEDNNYYKVDIEPNIPRFCNYKTEIVFKEGIRLQFENDLINKSNVILKYKISPTILKFIEANYFRDLLLNNMNNALLTTFNLTAFLSAIRSCTFTLQKECDKKTGFEKWYSKIVEFLSSDTIMKQVVVLRNEALKEGLEQFDITHMKKIKIHKNDEITSELFVEVNNIDKYKINDILIDSKYIIDKIRDIIYEADQNNFLNSKVVVSDISAGILILKETEPNIWYKCDNNENLIEKYDNT